MNENDSKEAHEKRDADVAHIAENYRVVDLRLARGTRIESLLRQAWEIGFDYGRQEEHG